MMQSLWTRLTQTQRDFTLTVARWVLALIFFGHGTQKAFGWFGGMGFEKSLTFFQDTMSIPPALTIFVMCTELAAATGMVLGLLTRIAAFGLLSIMVVAPFANHLYPRFFMNWSGTRGGEGYEYHLLALALLLILMVRGGGAVSVDRLIASRTTLKAKVA
jgi:putative oxidoreductase